MKDAGARSSGVKNTSRANAGAKTAGQQRYAYGARAENSGRKKSANDLHRDRAVPRDGTVSRDSTRQNNGEPVMYVYDRICRRDSKQRELYHAYGKAAGRNRRRTASAEIKYASPSGGAKAMRKQRYKIVIENIINLFDSIEERRNKDVEAAKRNAIMKKKLLEHRRGFFLALFMTAFLTLFMLLIYNLFFSVRAVNIENASVYTSEEITAASGIEIGDKLYSFRSADVKNRITFVCPYIKNVEISRGVPDKVNIALESDTGAYVVNIYGDKLVLSEGLRILGKYSVDSSDVALKELRVPEIDYSVAGRIVRFVNEKNDRFVRSVLTALKGSGLYDRISVIDMTDIYDISMYCDNMYVLRLGGEKDLAHKLKMAERTLKDEAFNYGTPAEIDLSVSGEASVRYDHTLTYGSE